jgi:hypothetical protein
MENKISSREIFVNEILFHRADVIHLYGFIFSKGEYRPTRFVCSLPVLSSLLGQNGKPGRETISLIKDLLNEPHASPLSIDMVDRFGTTLPLEAFSIQMLVPLRETQVVEKAPQLLEPIFIERVIPFPAA